MEMNMNPEQKRELIEHYDRLVVPLTTIFMTYAAVLVIFGAVALSDDERDLGGEAVSTTAATQAALSHAKPSISREWERRDE
jgi:hypothetical protein